MLLLGITGGWERVEEKRYDMHHAMRHDAAAALVHDGAVIAAIEEERLNRIKHTNKAPLSAIRYCLERHGVRLKDVNRILVHGLEEYLNGQFRQYYLSDPRQQAFVDARALHAQLLSESFDEEVEQSKFEFVHHHLAHAITAYAPSGFDRSLIVTIDAYGDGVSGMVLSGEGGEMKRLASFPDSKSLGRLYLGVIRLLGYDLFDEYKVMGLAPYGDPKRFRERFKTLYTLLPNGDYRIHLNELHRFLEVLPQRESKHCFSQTHKDAAAALQESLEEIVFHVLRYYRKATNHRNLCLAGGVAHNCSLNGKILFSGLFDDVFVQPAAHDAGGAVGAALYYYYSHTRSKTRPSRLQSVYWGSEIGEKEHIRETLGQWSNLISAEPHEKIAEMAARLLAEGKVLGWVQGRSEFGPRALGNRSILADPRPAENKDLINAMVKKREAYRPFAPSVLEEYLDEYFEAPEGKTNFPFMVFVLRVRSKAQALLGAVTHVDGTARVQTVSKETNRPYWELIDAFRALTGVPVLLNTSFNNNVEPIVETVEDALVCFLTTRIDYLVVGNHLVEKRPISPANFEQLTPRLAPYAQLKWTKIDSPAKGPDARFEVGVSYDERLKTPVSSRMFDFLHEVNGRRTFGELCDIVSLNDIERESVLGELIELWSRRLVLLRPGSQSVADSMNEASRFSLPVSPESRPLAF